MGSHSHENILCCVLSRRVTGSDSHFLKVLPAVWVKDWGTKMFGVSG